MRIVQSFLSLATFAAISCSAAPVAQLQPREYLSSIAARDASELSRRGISVPVFETREESLGELDAREYDDLLLYERSYPWPGPGMQHQREHAGVPTTGYNPVPQNSYFPTANNVYTGSQVNAHAQHMVNSIATADPWNKKKNVKSYPKPSTGFRNGESDNPAPNSSGRVAYHAPINPPRSRFGPKRAATIAAPGRSARVGTDRVWGHRDPHNGNLDIGVSYHDHRKPIPSTSRNHPFSVAPQRSGGKMKAMGAKMGKTAKKVGNALAFWKKKGPRRSNTLP